MSKKRWAAAIIAGCLFFAGAVYIGRVFADRLLAGGPAATAAAREKNTIRGSVMLEFERAGEQTEGRPCSGPDVSKAFSDLDPGTTVVVKDEDGAILATGELSLGKRAENRCSIPFSVRDVPRSETYRIQVSDRPEQTFSHSRLKRRDFEVDLAAEDLR